MSDISPKAKELLLALAQELLGADHIELTGDGHRRVSSQAGVKVYDQPLGTVITADMEAEHQLKVKGIDPKASSPTAKQNKGANTYVSKVHVHPRDPGSKVYEFSDGTGVVEDARGNRTERKKLDTKALANLGWREHGNGPTAQDDIDAEKRAKIAKEKLKSIASTTARGSKFSAAVKTFEDYSEKIHEKLRKGDELGTHTQTVSDLRNLLEQSKTDERTTVHKGMTFASKQDRDVFVSQVLRPGHSFVDKSFVTATTHPDIAAQHADSGGTDSAGVIINVDIPKGSRAAALGHVKGSEDKDHEVLLGDGGRYVVKDIHSDEKGRHVAHVNYIDPLSGKDALEKQQDEEAIPERVWERKRSRRFAWDTAHITVDDDKGNPVVIEPQKGTVSSSSKDIRDERSKRDR